MEPDPSMDVGMGIKKSKYDGDEDKIINEDGDGESKILPNPTHCHPYFVLVFLF